MQSTFHDEKRRPRTVLRARAATEEKVTGTDPDWERMMEVVIVALDPFPEARLAVAAALEAAGNGVGPVG